MKLLLIYTKKEEDTAVRLKSLLSELDILFDVFLPDSPENMNIKQFTAFFDFSGSEEDNQDNVNTPTHVLVASPLNFQWFNFFAGFAFGSKIHILIYGQEAITGISEEIAVFFTFLGTDASLQTYLEVENEVYKKQEAAKNIIKAQQSLLKIGVPITVNSLAQCVSENRAKEISFFLAAGFSVNSKNNTGVPLLNIAARNGSYDVIRYLITSGADVNLLAEDRGTTALMDSVMAQYLDIANDLINAGTDLNVKDRNGQTALIVAAGASDEKMVELLLKAGADPDITDSLGASAKKYATLFNNKTILALFNNITPAK